MPIRQLAPDVAAKIAAGEVVERPASVVKELIENSIDAGSTQIRVNLLHGGLQLIQVTDNGVGIPASELSLALTRHATSKVAQIDDLEQIRSLGFRGEALASIAAVAEVTLVSRPRGSNQASEISATGGRISEVTPAASPEGTAITVRNLFQAVPARLKFLKSRNTEVSHCHHLLEQYALAYPEIRFTVTSENKQIFATPGDGKLSSVLLEIYGLSVVDQMVPIQGELREEEPEYPVVTGYVSRPTCYKSTRQHMSFFVNRRWVLSRMLTHAVEEAYHSLLLSGRHPIATINIEIDPSQIDVNVHPAKTEIRFLKERRVYAAVMRAARKAVLAEAEMPSWGGGSHGQSQTIPDRSASEPKKSQSLPTSGLEDWQMALPPTEARPTRARPSEDDLLDPELEALLNASDEPETTPEMSSGDEKARAKHVFPRDNPWLTVTEEETGTHPPNQSRLWQSHIHKQARGRSEQTGEVLTPDLQPEVTPATIPATDEEMPGSQSTDDKKGERINQPEEAQISSAAIPFLELGQARSTTGQGRRLPPLRVIGQMMQSFIVTEGPDGMYLIDQHAAHERILLEKMVAALKAREITSQLLLNPVQLDLSTAELGAIEEQLPQLEKIGFSLEMTDDQTLLTKAVPQVLLKQITAQSLREILIDLTAPEEMGHAETWEEHALANVACKAAIKANYYLTINEMREMIEQLEQTDAPLSGCHGRPTTIYFSRPALENEFGRR